MIIKNEGRIILEFGTGDICIAGGYVETEGENNKTGFVIFQDQEPRKIESIGSIKQGEVDLEDYPVVMTFSKKESIDAVISQLEKAKSWMDYDFENCKHYKKEE